MKHIFFALCILLVANTTYAQFQTTDKGLTILVTDGTDSGRNSSLQAPGEFKLPEQARGTGATGGSDIPTSYDQLSNKGPEDAFILDAPIRELGMTECIQAAAFLERPEYGKLGFMLIFSINDSIGGKQAVLEKNGQTYYGVYRLIRQKASNDEVIPKGMTSYQIAGTFLLLGMS